MSSGLRKRGPGTRNPDGAMDRGSKRQCDQTVPDDGIVSHPSNRLSHEARNVVDSPQKHTANLELSLDEQSRFPSFNTRCTSKDFVRAIKDFSARQKRAVEEIGMSGVLMLEITDPPLRLGRWLVTHLNPMNLSLEFSGGKTIPITKEDVATTLGMPLGTTEIMCRPSQKVGRELSDWRGEMGKRDSTVTLPKVCEVMSSCRDGGDWFKRHFSVAVATIFIESTQNGYANQQFLHHLDDVERIRELDWCGYLLKRLVKTHHDWVDDIMQRFTGPVLFLTMFYLDRVVVGARGIPRAIPAFIGWTSKLMKEREFMEIRGGGFGLGLVDIPLREPSGANEDRCLTSPTRHNQSFMERFAATTKVLAATVDELVQMVNDGREEIYDDMNFKLVLESAEKLLGLKRKDGTPPELTSTEEDDAFWADAAKLADAVERENAKKRNGELDDIPSFSLGLTQTQERHEWHGFEEPPTVELGGARGVILGMAPLKKAPPEKRAWNTDLVSANLLNRFGVKSGSKETHEVYTPSQIVLWRWVFNHNEHTNNEVMFAYNMRIGRLEDFLSLQFDTQVRVGVLDCWSCVLNEKEKRIKNYRPSRFFASTNTTLKTVVNATTNRHSQLKWFIKHLDGDLALAPHINHATVELFFFPILHEDHYYVVCINTRARRFDIIDNSSVSTKKEKYKEIPNDLLDMLSMYLEKKKQGLKAAIVSNLKPTRMRMPWRETTNKVDSGIYAMRHMETYMGEASHAWDCGIEKGNMVQLHNLRQKYMHDILMSDMNYHRESIIKHTRPYDI